jgi:hypothetical protein
MHKQPHKLTYFDEYFSLEYAVPIAVVRDLSAPQPTTPRHSRQQQQQHTAAAGRAASVRNTTAASTSANAYQQQQQQQQQSFGSCATGGYGVGYSTVGYTTSAMTSPEGDSAYYAKVAAAQQQQQQYAQRSQQHHHQQAPLQQGQVSTLILNILYCSSCVERCLD